MKLRKIEVDVKIELEDGQESVITVSDSYSEPESMSDVRDLSISDEDKIRAFQYGLYNIRSSKLRAANNFGSLARKLFETKVFGSTKEALEFIIKQRGLNS
jgi:hypothetical protein